MSKTIPLQNLTIPPERQRKEFRSIRELAISLLKTGGTIHDIVVDQDNQIIAGERRSRAYRLLATWSICAECFYAQETAFVVCPECNSTESVDQEPWLQVPVKTIHVEDDYHRRLLELEENVNREDLTPAESAAATAELHDLYTEREGKKIGGSKKGWSAQDTANKLGISAARVSQHRKTQRLVAANPDLKNEATEAAIWTKFRSARIQAIRTEIARRRRVRGDSPVSVVLKCGDGAELTSGLDAGSVDLVIADVPYGIEVFSSLAFQDEKHRKEFDDSKAAGDKVLTSILPEINRVLRPNTHAFIFCSWHQTFTIRQLCSVIGLDMELPPLIWDRCQATPNRQETMGHDFEYEYIVHIRKGSPGGNQRLGSNVKRFKRITDTKYPNEKPLDLIGEFIEGCSEHGGTVLDPCCGSGSVVVRAAQLQRRGIGFDINQNAIDTAESRIVLEIDGEADDSE